jgi:hypothetical protein
MRKLIIAVPAAFPEPVPLIDPKAEKESDVCESCEQKNDVIVALQHVIRELRHDLSTARIEAELSKGTELFALEKAA